MSKALQMLHTHSASVGIVPTSIHEHIPVLHSRYSVFPVVFADAADALAWQYDRSVFVAESNGELIPNPMKG